MRVVVVGKLCMGDLISLGTQVRSTEDLKVHFNFLVNIMRCKTIAMSNPKPGHEVPCNQLWEFHFALVGTNKVQALGYNVVPRVM